MEMLFLIGYHIYIDPDCNTNFYSNKVTCDYWNNQQDEMDLLCFPLSSNYDDMECKYFMFWQK